MKDKSIKLSEEYGLNPSMVRSVCFYCGKPHKDKDGNDVIEGIALLGQIKTHDCPDAQAPMYTDQVFKLEPCSDCAKKFKDYVLMVEKPKDSDPTGRWAAVRKRVLLPEFRDSPVAFMLPEDFETLISKANK